MAWRIVQQPNGLLALFSDIVDNFTAYNMTHDEAVEECRGYNGMGQAESEDKVQRGIVAGAVRWNESIKTIRIIHGKKEADALSQMLSVPPS